MKFPAGCSDCYGSTILPLFLSRLTESFAQRTTGFVTRLSVTNGELYASQASIPPLSGRTLVISLAGSRAVENDVAIPGNLCVALFDLFQGKKGVGSLFLTAACFLSVGGGRIGSVVLRNRKEVASGREDRELPHVIQLVKAFEQRDKFTNSIESQGL